MRVSKVVPGTMWRLAKKVPHDQAYDAVMDRHGDILHASHSEGNRLKLNDFVFVCGYNNKLNIHDEQASHHIVEVIINGDDKDKNNGYLYVTDLESEYYEQIT